MANLSYEYLQLANREKLCFFPWRAILARKEADLGIAEAIHDTHPAAVQCSNVSEFVTSRFRSNFDLLYGIFIFIHISFRGYVYNLRQNDVLLSVENVLSLKVDTKAFSSTKREGLSDRRFSC